MIQLCIRLSLKGAVFKKIQKIQKIQKIEKIQKIQPCIFFCNKKEKIMNLFVYSIISKILAITVPLLLGIALLTLAERQVMASKQRRKGPNKG